MSVSLEPAELGFKRPFNHEVSQVLRLINGNNEPVAFKVKTTAPKQYCVRPNSGRIESGGAVEVSVLLQAMKEDPPLDARCRDKFLVQSVAIPTDQDTGNITQIWANIEQTAKSSIQERKIRVHFLPADGSAAVGDTSAINGVSSIHEDDHPPAYASTSPVAPQREAPAAPPKDARPTEPSSVLQSATAAVASATGINQADLQRKLDEANATITRLQQQAAEGLRKRNVIGGGSASGAGEKSSTKTLQQAPPAGGVPIQIVALLCLLIFLVTYIFL